MQGEAEAPGPSSFALRGGGAIQLHAGGVGHPRSVRFGGAVFSPYEDVTHVTVGPGGLRLGTLRGSFLFRSSDFAENGAHRTLVAALRAGIAALPDGAARLARMAELDELARRRRRTPVTAAVTAACAGAFVLSMVAPQYHEAGIFSALLVRLGETWRLVTANFLHAGPGHLLMNGLGLVVLGGLAERALGSRAMGVVVTLAGLGAMAGCELAGYSRALGASGIVSGIAGALLWMELRVPASLPVGLRVPRRIFVALLAAEAIFLFRLPHIAHAAHFGGFAAGVLGAAALGPGRSGLLTSRAGLRALSAASLAIVVLAGVAWVRSVAAPDPETIARRGEALLEMPGVPPDTLNDEAWRIAISEDPSAGALDVALRLAERAVEETAREVPAVLDTLAELHFLRGDAEKAIEIGHEALALAPDVPYYREQIRRFTGERAKGDRPEAPPDGGPVPRDPRRRPGAPEERGPGIRV
jgi:rhomboid protease GluP